MVHAGTRATAAAIAAVIANMIILCNLFLLMKRIKTAVFVLSFPLVTSSSSMLLVIQSESGGQAGVQPESKEGLPLDPTVQLAMDWPLA